MSVFSRLADYLTGRDIERSLAVVPERRAAPYVLPAYQYQGGVATWPDRDVGKNIQAHYFNVAVIFRCVTVLSDAVAEAPLRVYQETEDGQPKELPKRPVRRLLMRPNPQMSESEFHVFTVSILALAGFCVIEKERSEAGRVVRLWHLRPDWLAPKYRDNAPPNWVYRVPGREPTTLDARDVIVVTYRSDPFFKATGVAPLDIVAREAAIDNVATDFVKNMFDRGGAPPLYLKWTNDKMPNPDPAIFDTVRELWAQKAAGAGNWTLPPVAANVEPVPIGWSPNDMAYPDLRYLSASRICSAFGVDERLVGVSNEQPTYENFEAAMRSLQLHTANPLRARLDGAFTRALLPEFEDDPTISLEFDTSKISVLQEDTDAVNGRARANFAAGFISMNEARTSIGLPEHTGKLGEAYFLGTTASLIDFDGNVLATTFRDPTKPPVEPTPKDTNAARSQAPVFRDATNAIRSWFDETGAIRDADDDPIELRNGGNPVSTLWRYAHALLDVAPRLYPLPVETRAAAVDTARETFGRIATKHEPKLAAFWVAQGERVADAVASDAAFRAITSPGAPERESAAPPEVRDLGAIRWEDEANLLRDVLAELYDDAGIAAFEGVAALMASLGVEGVTVVYDTTNPRIKDIAHELGQRIVGITEETRRRVADVIAEALTDKASGREVAKRLRAQFEEMAGARAETVARTEAMYAYNRTNILAYEESGVVAAVQCHDSKTHSESYGASDGLSCTQRDGLIVPLDQAHRHLSAEHPNGQLALSPVTVLSQPLGG